MEEYLIKLICREYRISESELFSKYRGDLVARPLQMLTYILNVDVGLEIPEIYAIYSRKGYTKHRSTPYHYVSKVRDDISVHRPSMEKYLRIKELLDSYSENPSKEDDFDYIRGRLLRKLMSLKTRFSLKSLEEQVDNLKLIEIESEEKQANKRQKEVV